MNIEEQIKMLLELQELDKEIFEKKWMLEAIPEKKKELDSLLEEKTVSLKNLDDESKTLQLKRKDKETDLGTKEETIKKYQGQLFQTKTNKEYTVLEKEIASTKADNSLLEEEILKLFDEADEIKQKVDKEKEVFAEEKIKIEEEKKKLEEEKKQAETEHGELNNKRTSFREKIDKSFLSKYERILENRDGLAMVPIEGDACGGCNMNLPPQVINETKLKAQLTFCGNCARLLYSKD